MSYNKKYVPKTLTKEDKKKQIKSIKEQKDRPKVKSFESKRSPFVIRFEKKFGFPITDKTKINKSLLATTGINKILKKGMAAYYTGGSRPNRNELLKYGEGEIKKEALKKFTHKMPNGQIMTGKKHDKNSKKLTEI